MLQKTQPKVTEKKEKLKIIEKNETTDATENISPTLRSPNATKALPAKVLGISRLKPPKAGAVKPEGSTLKPIKPLSIQPQSSLLKPRRLSSMQPQRSFESVSDVPSVHDPFDRDPEPKSPQWQQTLVHSLKVESSAAAFIDAYYACDGGKQFQGQNIGESQRAIRRRSTGSSLTSVSDLPPALKRNAILFPELNQEEIDRQLLDICELR